MQKATQTPIILMRIFIVASKTAQALARHGDVRLTMNVYLHIDQQEQVAAIGMLKGVEAS